MIYELSSDQTIKFWKFCERIESDYISFLRDEYNLIVSSNWTQTLPDRCFYYKYLIEGDEKDILYLLMKML